MINTSNNIQLTKQKNSILKALFNTNFILLTLINTCNTFTNVAVKVPVQRYGKALGISATVLGLVATLYFIVVAAARPVSGRWADKMDRKKWLIACFVFKIIAYVAQGFSNSIPLFIFSRLITGVAFALVGTALPAVVSKAIDKKSLGTALGIFNAVPSLASSFAASVTLYVYTYGGMYSFLGSAGICVLAILFTLPLNMPKQNDKVVSTNVKKQFNINNYIAVKALPVCMMTFFIGVLFSAADFMLLLYADSKGIKDVAIWWTFEQSLRIIAYPLGGYIYDKFGISVLLVPSLIGTAVSSVLLGTANSCLPIAIAGFIYGFAYNGTFVALQAAAAKTVPREQYGVALSTSLLFMDIASIGGSAIPAFMADMFGYGNAFIVMTIFPVLGLIWFMVFRKRMVAIEAAGEA